MKPEGELKDANLTLIPKEEYQDILDYQMGYLGSPTVRQKLREYYLKYSKVPKGEVDVHVDRALNDAKAKLERRKIFYSDKYIPKGAGAVSLKDTMLVRSELKNSPYLKSLIAHEYSHDSMEMGSDFYGMPDWVKDTNDVGWVGGKEVQSQYKPLGYEAGKKPMLYDYVKAETSGEQGSSELRAFLGSLRAMHKIDPDKPVTLDAYPGLKDDYWWKELRKVYSEEDLLEMLGGDRYIVQNDTGGGGFTPALNPGGGMAMAKLQRRMNYSS